MHSVCGTGDMMYLLDGLQSPCVLTTMECGFEEKIFGRWKLKIPDLEAGILGSGCRASACAIPSFGWRMGCILFGSGGGDKNDKDYYFVGDQLVLWS